MYISDILWIVISTVKIFIMLSVSQCLRVVVFSLLYLVYKKCEFDKIQFLANFQIVRIFTSFLL